MQLEQLDLLRSCVGWQLESAKEDPVSGELALRLGGLFRLRLAVSRGGATGAVELLPAEEAARAGIPADRRLLAGALAGCGGGERGIQLAAAGTQVAAAVQAATARLGRIAGLVGELDGLRLALPPLAEVACSGSGVRLALLNLDAEVKFEVELTPGPDYPAGPLPHTARIVYGGEGQVTERAIAEAVAAAPEAAGRLRDVAAALAALARAATPRPAGPGSAAFHSSWQNPLYGSPSQQHQLPQEQPQQQAEPMAAAS